MIVIRVKKTSRRVHLIHRHPNNYKNLKSLNKIKMKIKINKLIVPLLILIIRFISWLISKKVIKILKKKNLNRFKRA
jgi:hypothetical protein